MRAYITQSLGWETPEGSVNPEIEIFHTRFKKPVSQWLNRKLTFISPATFDSLIRDGKKATQKHLS